MSKMKRVLSLGLTLVLGASVLAGCGNKNDSTGGGANKSNVIKIGLR